MKPNFALKLSNDGIELLHRAAAGWQIVGSLSFETDDVAAGCARLLDEAKRLEPGGLRTKLVLPDSEVRYSTVLAPGPTDEARRYQIEAEIEALTPYSIDDLAYDWSVEGDHALVVVCARETLIEAEGFADGYGFNPVSFVAIPHAGEFAGEPFFGQTTVAAAYLDGQALQRDSEPVRVTGPAKPAPIAKPAAETPPAPAAAAVDPKPQSGPVSPPQAKRGPATAEMPSTRGATAPVDAPRGLPVSASVAAAKSPVATPPATAPAKTSAGTEPLSVVSGLVRRMGNRLRRERAQQDTQATATPASASPSAAPPPPPRRAGAASTVPTASDTRPPVPVPAPRPAPGTQAAAPVPRPAPVESAAGDGAVAFASRRRPGPSIVSAGPGGASGAASPGGRIAVTTAAGRDPAEAAGIGTRLVRRARRTARQALVKLGLREPGRNARAARRRAAEPEPIVPASRPPASDREKASEAEALTIFGARGNQRKSSEIGRRVLLAGGGVLLLAVSVAVWMLYFGRGDTPTLIAGDPLPGAVGQIQAPAGVAAPDAAAPIQTPPALTAAPPRDTAAAPADPVVTPDPASEPVATAQADASAAPVEADPDQLLESLVQQALTATQPAEPFGRAASDPAPDGSAATGPDQDGSGLAAAGTTVESTESPQVAGTAASAQQLRLPGGFDMPSVDEVAFVAPAPPPPPGAQFTFDENGLVEATPEGALTPSGVTVFARRPAQVPQPRPGGIAPEPVAQEPGAAADPVAAAIAEALAGATAATDPASEPASETAPDDTPRADPALAGFRPQPRSPRVEAIGAQQTPAAPDPEQLDEDAALEPAAPSPTQTADLAAPPPGGVSLAALRPQRRPTDLVPAAVAAPEPEPEPTLDLSGATEEAVAASIMPSARPTDVAERARAALAAARPAQSAAQTAAPAAPADPTDEEDEGDVPASASAGPQIPSSASVARQATDENAIRLNRINLIGVFGTANNRRALVRLSSGRVVRVQVGDRLDGGQVTAIGETELRYSRDGRNEILSIGG